MDLIIVAFLVGLIIGSVGGGLEMRRRLRDEEEDRQFWSEIVATRARVTEPPAFPKIPGLVSHWTAGEPIPPGMFGGSGQPVLHKEIVREVK